MNFTRHLDRLAAALAALAGLLPRYPALPWRPEAIGPLFAGAAGTSGCWAPALPIFNDERTLRIGAYRCRRLVGRKCCWP